MGQQQSCYIQRQPVSPRLSALHLSLSGPRPISEPSIPSATSIPTPILQRSLWSCSVNNIPEECSICLGPFHELNPDTSTTEKPVVLYCNHIFGHRCLNNWLSTSPHKNCPECRRSQVHKCGHICKGRTADIPPVPVDPTTGSFKTPVLEDDCIACYTKRSTVIIKSDPVLVNTQKSCVRSVGIEILAALGECEWKGLRGNWESVLDQLIKRFPPLSEQPTKKDLQYIATVKRQCQSKIGDLTRMRKRELTRLRDNFTLNSLNEQKDQLSRLERMENEAVEKYRFTMFIRAIVASDVVDMKKLYKAWVAANIPCQPARRRLISKLKKEYLDAVEEARTRFIRQAIKERW